MSRFLAFSLCLMCVVAWGDEDTVAVSRNDLSNLKEFVKQLHITAKKIADDNGTVDVIPNPDHLRRFREDMTKLGSILVAPGQLDDTVDRLLKAPLVKDSGIPVA